MISSSVTRRNRESAFILSQKRITRFFAVEIAPSLFRVTGYQEKFIYQKRPGFELGQSLFEGDDAVQWGAPFHIGERDMGQEIPDFHVDLGIAGRAAAGFIELL